MKQTERILAHMQAGHSINHVEAQQLFNCDRLGARIHDLRAAGHKIIAVDEPNVGKPGTHARYFLLKEGDAVPSAKPRRRFMVGCQGSLFEGEPA